MNEPHADNGLVVEKKMVESPLLDFETLFEKVPVLKQILHNIKQMVWLIDSNSGQIIFVSPAFEEVWGRSREIIYANPFLLIESVHPEDRVKVMSALADQDREPVTKTYRIMRPDGTQRWISEDSFLVEGGATHLVYRVCISQDITEQNKVDETLRKALDRSREQSSLSRRMSLARKPEAVLRTLMSATALRNAKRAYILFFEHPERGPAYGLDILASWSAAQGGDEPFEWANEAGIFDDLASLELYHPSKPVLVSQVRNDHRLSSGVQALLAERQVQSISIFPLVALGKWFGCLMVFFSQENIFEQIELRHIKVSVDQAAITLFNLQLLEIEAESRFEAERANEIKTKFLAMISHELRTPLTSIKGFATTLLADDVVWEPEEQRDFVQTIQQETHRLQELIDHLLDLSRLEAGMLPIDQQSNKLNKIIEDALPQFLVMAQNHTLSVRLPTNLPPVFVDAKRITQVLENLIHNAVLYSPEGTEIILTASLRGGFVQVNVIDHGSGIPQAERKRVFQAFRRGKREEDGVVKGTGLGLAICKGLVEAHGGRIWIKRRTVPGTTIAFTIPLATSDNPLTTTSEV